MIAANKNVRPFTIYRIICTITGKPFCSGSNRPHHNLTPAHGCRTKSGQWYDRGQWGGGGVFFRTPEGVKKNLLRLCFDWRVEYVKYYWNSSQTYFYYVKISDVPDYSRLLHLRVEQTVVNDYDVSEIGAADFMGLRQDAAA